jgi:RNA polymerase sigma-70 factor (ECF subfamily)
MTACLPAAPAAERRTLPAKSFLQDPDVALMLRVQNDDPGAFQQLVDRYWYLIFGRFYRCLGDRQLAEDLTQETCLRLYRNRRSYQPQAKFATWLFHIVENLTRNAIRDRRRLRHGVESLNNQHLSKTVPMRGAPVASPDRLMESAEAVAIVREGIEHLIDRQREALILHEYKDHTYVEIANSLDITPEAAKSLLYRARNQLRHNLRPRLEAIA